MDDLKNISIDTTVSFSEDSFEDDRYIKGRIKIMHAGKNPNNSNFNSDSINDAKWSLSNIFVLANVVEDSNGIMDFGAHDVRIEENKFDESAGFKLIYEELPIGIIGESNNYEYKKDEVSDRWYVYADFLLVRDYSNYAEDIVKRYISEGKPIKVSMEIAVDDYKFISDKSTASGYYDILKYRYLAVTMLGAKYGTGMLGAKIDFESRNTERINKCMERLDELKSLFSCKSNKEDEILEDAKETIVEDFTKVDDIVEEEANTLISTEETFEKEPEKNESDEVIDELVLENNNNSTEEYIASEFSMTSRQKIELLNNSIENDVVLNEEEEAVSGISYWVKDYDDMYVYINAWEWGEGKGEEYDYRAEYTIDEENMTANINKATFEVVIYQPITKAEKDLLDESRMANETRMQELEKENLSIKESNETLTKDVESLNGKIEEFNSILTEKDETIKNLESFKSDIERQIEEIETEAFKVEVDELIEEFTKDLNEVAEFQELKEKCYDMELTAIEDYCLLLVGKLNHKKETKSKKQTKFNKSIIGIVMEEDKDIDNVCENEYLEKYGEYALYLKKSKK